VCFEGCPCFLGSFFFILLVERCGEKMGSFHEAHSDVRYAAVRDRFVRFVGVAFVDYHAFDETFEGLGDVKRGVEDGFVGLFFSLRYLSIVSNEMGEHFTGGYVDSAFVGVGDFVEVIAVIVFLDEFLESYFHVNIILPRILGFFPEPAGCFAFGGGTGGVAGSRVRWWYCGGGDAIAGESGGFVFEHPDVHMRPPPVSQRTEYAMILISCRNCFISAWHGRPMMVVTGSVKACRIASVVGARADMMLVALVGYQ
jgi:hypothetical protein